MVKSGVGGSQSVDQMNAQGAGGGGQGPGEIAAPGGETSQVMRLLGFISHFTPGWRANGPHFSGASLFHLYGYAVSISIPHPPSPVS